jgi:hypothetical protein
MLASVSYPSMPTSFATQLDMALASESASRVATAPTTEAGRRDLPERRSRRSRAGWQLPGMSVVATRLVAGAGVLIAVGVGGYEIASHAGNSVSGTAASSAGSASVPSARQLSLGPTVRYGQASGPETAQPETVQTVRSGANFTTADLATQALGAVRAARLAGATGAQPRAVAPAPSTAPGSAASSSFGNQTAPARPSGLASCLDGLVGSQPVQLVETAKFDGAPATIIVTARTATHPAQVWAVGPACSASHPDVLAHQTLTGT